VRWTWRVKLYTHLEMDLFAQLRERAETEAIDVFAANLKDLLLAAPAGPRPTIGLDPGLRTGVKVAVVDATAKVLEHTAIFPNAPQRRIAEAEATLLSLIQRHGVELIAIGNGTASRETERFVADLLAQHKDLRVTKVMVNESGASIYSASEYASRELPDLDVTIRGAVSIARRLQDPLAELVKIEPKSIGVGQYQHDVSQVALSRALDAVIEDCVNAVGVDVNTASSALLSRISGLNSSTAEHLVQYREENGMLPNRQALLSVPRIGNKTFELAAGFLRVMNGDNPLDRSAVHPESYHVVDRIAQQSKRPVEQLVGDATTLRGLKPEAFVDDQVGLPTIKDILAELEKPGRDPRPEFKTASFKEGVEKLSDLREDMVLEGVVTNVTNFGAFVDVGVHQDGLVHISALADKFVKDPRDVVKAGDIVRVKVMEVDVQRKRIALSMRLDDQASERASERGERSGDAKRGARHSGKRSGQQRKTQSGDNAKPAGALAAAFAAAQEKQR
ncbi:MAG: helix-hairpin-helix domain-containing protein, partial [Halieaceae bacterium]|nr:helix-hairpin-helix domain-containing protein [Halieaceae bacterium]